MLASAWHTPTHFFPQRASGTYKHTLALMALIRVVCFVRLSSSQSLVVSVLVSQNLPCLLCVQSFVTLRVNLRRMLFRVSMLECVGAWHRCVCVCVSLSVVWLSLSDRITSSLRICMFHPITPEPAWRTSILWGCPQQNCNC